MMAAMMLKMMSWCHLRSMTIRTTLSFLLGLLILKICINNDTCLDLEQFNVADPSAPSWGPNLLDDEVNPGGNATVEGLSPGTYDIRAVFDDKQDCVDNDVYVLEGVELNTTNLCITFDQGVSCCADVYATLDYVI